MQQGNRDSGLGLHVFYPRATEPLNYVITKLSCDVNEGSSKILNVSTVLATWNSATPEQLISRSEGNTINNIYIVMEED